jgi:hypothetical protein
MSFSSTMVKDVTNFNVYWNQILRENNLKINDIRDNPCNV